MQDQAAKRSELDRRVEEKRRELMRAHRVAMTDLAARDPQARKVLDQMRAAYDAYLDEDPVLPAFSEELQHADIAPLPATELDIALSIPEEVET